MWRRREECLLSVLRVNKSFVSLGCKHFGHGGETCPPQALMKTKIVRDHVTLSGLPCAKHGCLFSSFQGYFSRGILGSLSLFCFAARGDVSTGWHCWQRQLAGPALKLGNTLLHFSAGFSESAWISVTEKHVSSQKKKKKKSVAS